ncbi:hypothetical protein AB205_0166890, partial [Aquarana catesbeiana]
ENFSEVAHVDNRGTKHQRETTLRALEIVKVEVNALDPLLPPGPSNRGTVGRGRGIPLGDREEADDSSSGGSSCPFISTVVAQMNTDVAHMGTDVARISTDVARMSTDAARNDDSDNDGEPNEYDLEDSFIDDDEEEEDFTDEDSDWMPDSEEKDSEDVNQLVKEAKRFVKGKH